MALLVGGAVALGTLGLARSPLATLAAAAIACVPAGALVGLAWRRAEHTLAGELVAAVALTGAAAPVLVAGGGSLAAALALWAGWALGFGAMVVAIHRVLARHKRRPSPVDAITVVGLLAVTLVALAMLPLAVPLVALATLVALVAPSAARLRAIGIAAAVVAVLAGVSVLL